MTEHLKVYTEEQMIRVSQFKRANDLLKAVVSREDEVAKGTIWVKDNLGVGHNFDFWELRMLRGALFGLYNEAVSLGVKEEVK